MRYNGDMLEVSVAAALPYHLYYSRFSLTVAVVGIKCADLLLSHRTIRRIIHF